jgi:hypothetical protein
MCALIFKSLIGFGPYATFIIFSPVALSPIIRITQIFPMSSMTSGQDRGCYKRLFVRFAPIASLWVSRSRPQNSCQN